MQLYLHFLQGHLPCLPHAGNLFSLAPFSWRCTSLRNGLWSVPCFRTCLKTMLLPFRTNLKGIAVATVPLLYSSP